MKQPLRVAAPLVILALAVLGSMSPASAATSVAAVADLAPAAAAPATSVTLTLEQAGDLAGGEPLRGLVTLENPTPTDTFPATATMSVDPTRLTSRSALDDWFSGKSNLALASRAVARTDMPAVSPLVSGAVDMTAPASALPFTAGGVYAVSVQVIAHGIILGTARSAVAWNVTAATAVPVAIAVPITVPAGESEFLTATQLTQYTAPDGILTRELTDVEDSQIAIGIDPRVIASIRVLGTSAPASALAWLDALKNLPNETFPLAWADADLTAPLHAGSPEVIEPKSLDYAINPSLFGPSTTPSPTPTSGSDTSVVPTSASLVAWDYTLPTLQWPAESSVEPSDLAKLSTAGISRAILTSANVDEPNSKGLGGASGQSGPLTIAVSDDVLSGYLRQAIEATTRIASVTPLTQLTTSLALVGLESGKTPRTVLLTAGRNWATSGINFTRSVSDLYARPWITSAVLSSVFADAPTKLGIDKNPESADRIPMVSDMLLAEARLVRFAPIAKTPSAITSSYRLQLLSVLSNEWAGDSPAWTTAATAYVSQCDKVTASVQLSKSSTIVAGADQISVPVSISNGLDQDVTINLVVRATTFRVTIEPKDKLQTVTVPANSQRRVQIPIQAISNGNARLVVSLTSATGVPIGRSVIVKVNVQAGWETAGTLIFVALVVALFVFGLVRNIRKRRRANADDLASTDE